MEGLKSELSVSNNDSALSEEMAVRIVSLLLLIAAASLVVLWTLNPVGSGSENTFAPCLGVDLTSVAMISYVQRSIKSNDRVGRTPLIAGCCFILFLVLVSLHFAA